MFNLNSAKLHFRPFFQNFNIAKISSRKNVYLYTTVYLHSLCYHYIFIFIQISSKKAFDHITLVCYQIPTSSVVISGLKLTMAILPKILTLFIPTKQNVNLMAFFYPITLLWHPIPTSSAVLSGVDSSVNKSPNTT